MSQQTQQTEQAERGRPKGSRNKQHDQTDGELTRCRKCGSTEREPYFWKTVTPHKGLLTSGQPYTHIIRRLTRCLACGQSRIDRHHENRVAKK